MRHPPLQAFVANTDSAWFDFLGAHSSQGHVDEVNFWQPRATRPMRAMALGEPVFFRLKKPRYAIAGYGHFAHFRVVDLDTCWELFGWKNGDPTKERFLRRMGQYRRTDLFAPGAVREPIGCTVLRDAQFWPEDRWIPWGDAEGWASNIVQGKTETDPARVTQLMNSLSLDNRQPLEEFASSFVPLDVDERSVVLAEQTVREGQASFRLRLLDAYKGRCAITGEHTEPVLDAAHIQPYLGPRSNHLQNGLLLTKEFHALFDRGYVAITPDLKVRVSPRLQSDWQNGRRYYPYDGLNLQVVPDAAASKPSRDALAWHLDRVFMKSA